MGLIFCLKVEWILFKLLAVCHLILHKQWIVLSTTALVQTRKFALSVTASLVLLLNFCVFVTKLLQTIVTQIYSMWHCVTV